MRVLRLCIIPFSLFSAIISINTVFRDTLFCNYVFADDSLLDAQQNKPSDEAPTGTINSPSPTKPAVIEPATSQYKQSESSMQFLNSLRYAVDHIVADSNTVNLIARFKEAYLIFLNDIKTTVDFVSNLPFNRINLVCLSLRQSMRYIPIMHENLRLLFTILQYEYGDDILARLDNLKGNLVSMLEILQPFQNEGIWDLKRETHNFGPGLFGIGKSLQLAQYRDSTLYDIDQLTNQMTTFFKLLPNYIIRLLVTKVSQKPA